MYPILRRALMGGVGNIFYNINPLTSANFLTAFKAGGDVFVGMTGDSTEKGVDETTGTPGTAPYATQYPNAGPMFLADMFQAAGINAGCDNIYGHSGTTLNDYLIRDNRVTITGGTVVGSVQCQGGASWLFPGVASTFSYTSRKPCTSADIYWRDTGAGNNADVAVDGVSVGNINSTGTFKFAKTTFSGLTLGIHTIKLTWVAGNVNFFGIDCQDRTGGRKEITFRQWGTSGATSTTMISNVGTPNGGRLQQRTTFPVHLIISEEGLVNDGRTGVSLATSKSNMLADINAAKATNTDFWFLTPPFDSTIDLSLQNALSQQMYDLAQSENVGLIDRRKAWKSYANEKALGLVGDGVHPTKLFGYPDEARMEYQAFRRVI